MESLATAWSQGVLRITHRVRAWQPGVVHAVLCSAACFATAFNGRTGGGRLRARVGGSGRAMAVGVRRGRAGYDLEYVGRTPWGALNRKRLYMMLPLERYGTVYFGGRPDGGGQP